MKKINDLQCYFRLVFAEGKNAFYMSENALDRKGELGRYSTRRNQKLTRQCEQASGILHPCSKSISSNRMDKNLF